MSSIQVVDQRFDNESLFDSRNVISMQSSTDQKSIYSSIQTRNVKFEKFVSEVLKSKMNFYEAKDNLVKYV